MRVHLFIVLLAVGCGARTDLGTATPPIDADVETEAGRIGLVVTTGVDATCAIRGGEVFCWGLNNDAEPLGIGQGDGPKMHVSIPTLVALASADEIRAGYATMARVGTKVFAWGWSWLGNGTSLSSTPVEIPFGPVDPGFSRHTIASNFCCRSMGEWYCWGSNSSGQLLRPPSGAISTPIKIAAFAAADEVALGDRFECVRWGSHRVECVGRNDEGVLGDGTTQARSTLAPVLGLDNVAQVTASRHACARMLDGTVMCWGRDTNGQLGDGTFTPMRTRPVAVVGLKGSVHVAAGAAHTCAITSNRHVVCWGGNKDGQLGDGTFVERSVPTRVVGLDDVDQLDVGSLHSCAVTRDHRVFCWGLNNVGQVGDGTFENRNTPTLVKLPQ